MKLDRADRYIQLPSNLLVGLVSQHSLQYFLLPGTEGRRACYGSALFEELLCSLGQTVHQNRMSRDQDIEVRRLRSASETFHRQQPGYPLDRKVQVGGRPRSKLCGPS